MTWRGATPPLDRAFACLPYLLPFFEGLMFGIPFFNQFPALNGIWLPFLSVAALYNRVPFLGLIVFFALFLLVVRNESINHFIRFNAMQAILIDIVLILCGLVLSLLQPALGSPLIVETLYNVIFLGMLGAVLYSVVQSIMGRYAEIPTLSDAVYMQVR